MRRRTAPAAWGAALAVAFSPWCGPAFAVQNPEPGGSIRFVLVGDTGTGDARARRVAAAIRRYAEAAPVSHLFFLGDNVYEDGNARSIGPRFLDVYHGVFALGMRTHAALGNHDVQRCRDAGRRPVPRDGSAYARTPGCWVDEHLGTPEFGYRDAFRYYSVEILAEAGSRSSADHDVGRAPLVEVFVLDTNTLGAEQQRLASGTDEAQLSWLPGALGRSRARWKVIAMHHPMYAPERCRWLVFGCRGDDRVLRAELEPIFRQHGVHAVFQAHQHFYARMTPQHGIRYFVTGAGGKKPDSTRPDTRAVGRADRGAFNHFVAVEATEDRFDYTAVDAAGAVRDRGSFGGRDSAGDAHQADASPCSRTSTEPPLRSDRKSAASGAIAEGSKGPLPVSAPHRSAGATSFRARVPR